MSIHSGSTETKKDSIPLNGGQIVVECLKEQGTKIVFGVPGGQTLYITDAILEDDAIDFIATRHEGGAACAADGYGRVTGKPGVCLATTGPGATNLLTGVGGAFRDSSPMIVLTCNNKRPDIGHGDAQDSDHVDVFRSLTKAAFFVDHIKELPKVMRAAYRIAMSGKKGPVLVDIARDVLEEDKIEFVPMDPATYAVETKFRPNQKAVEEAVQLLLQSKKPTFWAGNGVKLSNASKELLALAEILEIPIVTTFNGIGCVPTNHRLVFGPRSRSGTKLATEILQEADLVVVIGNSLNGPSTSRWSLPLSKNLIHIDVEENMIGKHYPIKLGILADLKSALQDIQVEIKSPDNGQRADWVNQLISRKQEWFKTTFPESFETISPVKPQTIMQKLSEFMPDDAIVSADAGNPGIWTHLLITKENTLYMKPVNFGNMGFGLPAAIGAKVAHPDREVFVVVGDGGLGMSLAEIETAVRCKANMTIILMNNQSYGNIKQEQVWLYKSPRYIGVDFTETDYVGISKAFGAGGERVDNPEQLVPALQRAREYGGVYLIDIRMDHSENIWYKPF
jgi:acetolactate synthase-1/2/3 large subunit